MFLRVLTALTICGTISTMGYAECILGNSGAEQITAVYFSNGMMATLGDAANSRIGLEREYARLAQGQLGSRYEFGISYNPTTHNLADDIRGVVSQKAAKENWFISAYNMRLWAGKLLQQMRWGETRVGMLEAARRLFPSLELTQDDLIEVADAAARHLANALLREVDPAIVATHVECYLRNLREGKRVVVVAHSQGNLYTNDVVDAVAEAMPEGGASIAVVGVATPAASIAGDRSDYVTAKDDVVINLLRSFASVLEGNVDNDPGVFRDRRDFWNHAFGRSYFAAGLESRAMIDALMNVLAAELPFPNEE